MKMGKPQERSYLTRTAILRAAEESFLRAGYDGTQVDQIARASGMSKGALYGHFGSKETLFLAVYEAKVADYFRRLKSQMGTLRRH